MHRLRMGGEGRLRLGSTAARPRPPIPPVIGSDKTFCAELVDLVWSMGEVRFGVLLTPAA